MRIASLGSGSGGNATLVEAAGTRLLIDCGFSLRELSARAARRGFDLASLDAVLVTHEHGDHANGVAALARRHKLPVYLTHGTASADRLAGCPNQCHFNADSSFSIGAIAVDAVAVPHDAREPVQYRLRHEKFCVGVLTDLGSITAHVRSAFGACDLLVLEFNHDREMLRSGPYPPPLKARVGGDWGHLSNAQSLQLLAAADLQRLQWLVVAHVSEQNNARGCVEALVEEHLPELMPRMCWADQDTGFDWLPLVSEPLIAAY